MDNNKELEELKAKYEALKKENEELKVENGADDVVSDEKPTRAKKLKGLGSMVNANTMYRKKKYPKNKY